MAVAGLLGHVLHSARATSLKEIALVGVLTSGAYFVYCLVSVRMKMRRIRAQGLPMPPHSFIWGHLPVLGTIMASMPPDAAHDYMQHIVVSQWERFFPDRKTCPPAVYIDTWPFAAPMLWVLDPAMSAQFTQDVSAAKIKYQGDLFRPLTDNLDLVSTPDYGYWKLLRRRFNPGFSPQNITSRVPSIVGDVETFAAILERNCGENGEWGSSFEMEYLTLNMTLDVMTRFLLNISTNEQSGKRSPLIAAMFGTVKHMEFYVNISSVHRYLNPRRWYDIWRNKAVMHAFLVPAIEKQAASFAAGDINSSQGKSLMHTAFESMNKESQAKNQDSHPSDPSSGLKLLTSPENMESHLSNLKSFLFAGHDTTATTLCTIFHHLIQHPDVLSRVRAEHDAVLGPDPVAAGAVLGADPYLVGSLVLTNAVIKEALRLHPIAGTARVGAADLLLVDPNDPSGTRYPTEDLFLWDGVCGIHHRDDIWPRPHEFVPDRWLVTDEKDPLYPPRNAWRSFEMGPRNCIGQYLAVVEMKIALALTARRFDIEHVWDKRMSHHEIWGDRYYLLQSKLLPRPKGSMPVRVRTRA